MMTRINEFQLLYVGYLAASLQRTLEIMDKLRKKYSIDLQVMIVMELKK